MYGTGEYGCWGVWCWGVGAGVLVLASMLLGCNSAGVWVLECMYVLMGAGVLVCGAGVYVCWGKRGRGHMDTLHGHWPTEVVVMA